MIVKIKSFKSASFGKLLKYILNKKERLFDKDVKSFVISYHLKGNTIAEWEKQFLQNETLRLRKRKDSVRLTHEILSWHKDDAKHLTLPVLEEMAREYIKQRNPKGMVIATPHFDKDHVHIHLCVSGVEYKTGKSLRLSKAALGKLKNGIQKYQVEKYPMLAKSVVEHGKKGLQAKSEKEYKFNWRAGRETDKEFLQKVITHCRERANSDEHFYELLKKQKLNTYKRAGKITGVLYNNRKFRFGRIENPDLNKSLKDKSKIRNSEISQLRSKKSKTIEIEKSVRTHDI